MNDFGRYRNAQWYLKIFSKIILWYIKINYFFTKAFIIKISSNHGTSKTVSIKRIRF